jgi:hypothetical protein
MQFLTGIAIIGAVSVMNAAEPGRITGVVQCDGTGANNVVVWAITSDCRVSYQTTEFEQNRFVFDKVPPGTYTVVGSCDFAYALPSAEFAVRSGATTSVDVYMGMRIDEKGTVAPGISPLNGRVVDEKGRAVSEATVRAETISFWPRGESTTDPAGRFGFCAVTQGRHSLVVSHPDYRTRKVQLSVGAFNYSGGQLEIKLRKR